MVILAQADLVVDLAATRASQLVKVKARLVSVGSTRALVPQRLLTHHPDQRGGINEPLTLLSGMVTTAMMTLEILCGLYYKVDSLTVAAVPVLAHQMIRRNARVVPMEAPTRLRSRSRRQLNPQSRSPFKMIRPCTRSLLKIRAQLLPLSLSLCLVCCSALPRSMNLNSLLLTARQCYMLLLLHSMQGYLYS